jgi:adenosine deaminase
MTSAFQTALEAGDLAGLRACPKADRHVHGIGGGSRDYLREKTGRDIAPAAEPFSSLAAMDDWTRSNVGDLFEGAAGRGLAFEATFAQARLDGVTFIEFGEDAWGLTLHGGDAGSVWNMLQAAHRRGGPDVGWSPQLGISRHCPVAAIEYWSAPLLELGVFTSLDLSGDEFAQPIEVFAPIYRRAKAAGLKLKAHVGEYGTADDVLRAVEVLELDEVQHGIAASSCPAAMQALAAAGVRLNVCPTSNVKLGVVDSLRAHPIRRLYDAGVRVTVNTDDPLIFGTSLSEEFLALFRAGVMTARELDELRVGALQ